MRTAAARHLDSGLFAEYESNVAGGRGACGAWTGLKVLALAAACATAARADDPPPVQKQEPVAIATPVLPDVAHDKGRFFLSGDGVIALENAHTREKVVVRYRDPSGAYAQDALDKLDGIFRSRGDDERTRVSLRLVELIDFLEDQEKPDALLLISGYRSEGYNAALIARGGQAARSSMHSEGLAADLKFQGVDHRALWDRLRARECCGAGYYEKSGFVHVDTGKPRFWEETTSKVKENLSKGNARVIARTDYDRYGDLVGLQTTLHSITLHPLRVSPRAQLVAVEGGAVLADLQLVAPGQPVGEDCIAVEGDHAGARQVLRVDAVEPHGPGTPDAPVERKEDVALAARVVLTTCEPRLEATPERIESNRIEASSAALQARRRAG